MEKKLFYVSLLIFDFTGDAKKILKMLTLRRRSVEAEVKGDLIFFEEPDLLRGKPVLDRLGNQRRVQNNSIEIGSLVDRHQDLSRSVKDFDKIIRKLPKIKRAFPRASFQLKCVCTDAANMRPMLCLSVKDVKFLSKYDCAIAMDIS